MLARGRFSPRWWRASLIGDSSLNMNYTQHPLNPAGRKYPAIVLGTVLFLAATAKLRLTFSPGAYIIDMAQMPQTVVNNHPTVVPDALSESHFNSCCCPSSCL